MGVKKKDIGFEESLKKLEEIASKTDNQEADYTSLVEDLTFYLNNPRPPLQRND